MRLVDTDALMESFETVLGAAPCELNGYEIWEVLNAQEPIDAIPVKWLKKVRKDDRLTIDDVETIDLILIWWQKEQEAKNES